jgi:hypothetical protein
MEFAVHADPLRQIKIVRNPVVVIERGIQFKLDTRGPPCWNDA